MATALWAIGAMILCSVFGAAATFFLKLAAPKMSLSIKKLLKNSRLFLGLFLYGIATLISLAALRAGELSVLYPFVALQYVWASFLSIKYLREKMSFLKWCGIALIFVGVSLIGIGV